MLAKVWAGGGEGRGERGVRWGGQFDFAMNTHVVFPPNIRAFAWIFGWKTNQYY
jgi:hypothetical protein